MANKAQVPVRERMTTIGEGGRRFWLYPAAFDGIWVKRRRILAYILVVIFFITPWTKVGGHQTILFDVVERKLSFFGFVFWPQDTLLFWCFLVTSVVTIFLITAIWGRLWCGWTCPQTVFLEHVFRRIEIWIEGDANQRRRLDQAPMSFEKFRKKALKYSIFLIISSHFANTVLCYFAGTDHVLYMTFHSPTENWGWFTFMAFFNFMFFANFAWFREQFCLIACPYGRFQSALLDEHSVIVGYDVKRGEPRGSKRKKAETPNAVGDCIDCRRCVAVCPTGIDIRQGLQMECINCTACIDACDEIMDKVDRPRGLIRYTSEAELENKKRKVVRGRTIGYSLIIMLVLSLGTFFLITKRDIRIQMLRPPGTSFSLDENTGMVTNLFQAKAVNRTERVIVLEPRIKDPYYQLTSSFPKWEIKPQTTSLNQMFVRIPQVDFSSSGKDNIMVSFYNEEDQLVFEKQITVLGPK